jgi:hypothetical protein
MTQSLLKGRKRRLGLVTFCCIWLLALLPHRALAQIYYTLNDGAAATSLDQLWRVNADGTGNTLIKSAFIQSAGALVVDAANNRLLVADIRPSQTTTSTTNTRIVAVSLAAGNAVTTVFTPAMIPGSTSTTIGGLTIDRANNYIYYTLFDATPGTSSDQLRRVNANGTGDILIKDNVVQTAGPIVFDEANNRVLLVDTRTSQSTTSLTNTKLVAVSLAAGNAVSTIVTPGLIAGAASATIRGLTVDKVNNRIYYTLDDGSPTTSTDQLRRVNGDGTGDVSIKDNFVQAAGPVTLDLANNRLLAVDSRLSQSTTSLTNTKLVAVSLAAGNAVSTIVTPAAITGAASTVIGGVAVPAVDAPTVTTAAASTVTATSAVLGGSVTADGGVTDRGVVYSTANTPPAIGGAGVTQNTNGTGAGAFSETITGLTAGTTYYVRAYATNPAGTSYGSVVQFVTPPNAPVVTAPANGSLLGTAFPAYAGTAQAGTTVTVYVDGSALSGTVTADGSGNWNKAQPTALSQGSHTVSATATINGSTASAASTTNNFTVDTVAPTVVSSVRQNPTTATTGATSLTFRVTFSEAVTGVTTGSFTFVTTTGTTTGTIASMAAVNGSNGTQYDVTVNSVSGTGTVRLDVKSSGTGITDAPGNALSGGYTSGQTYTVDRTAPTVTGLTTTAGSSTGTSPIPFTVTFSENVTALTAGGISVANGTVSGAVGGTAPTTTYTFNVTPASSGTVTVSIAANAVQDAAGNNNAASGAVSVTYTQPATAVAQNVTVNLAANGTATLNASSVNNGSTGGGTLTYTIQKIVYGKVPENQTLTLTTPNGATFTQVRFASYGTPAENGAGTGNYTLGGCSSGNSLATAQNSFGPTRSTGSMDAVNFGIANNNNPQLGDPCGGTPKSLAVQVGYSADAASLTYDCTEASKTQYVLLTVSNGTGTSTQVARVTVNPPPTAGFTLNPTSGNAGATITATGTNLSGATGLTVNGASATIGNLTATGFTFAVPAGASVGPGTVVLTTPCGQAPSAAFTVTQLVTAAPVITAPANNFLTNRDVTISGTAPAGSTVLLYVSQGGTAVSGSPFTAPAQTDGTFSFGPFPFADGTYQVVATAQTPGSSVSANSNTNAFTVDTTRPTVLLTSSSGPSGSTNVATPFAFTATFTEPVTGFVAGDLSVSNGTVTGFSGSGTTYTFTVTPTVLGAVTSVAVFVNSSQDAANNGNVGSANYLLTSAAPVVTVVPATLPNGTVGIAYSQTITASGATAPYTFAITAGALPAGLSLTSAGLLSGTPTAGGPFNFTVTATDASTSGTGGPYTGSRSYTLTIAAPTITLTPATLLAGTVATAYSQAITASGGTAPYSYAVTAGALPAGLSLNPSNGTLAGTPTASGTFNFTVTATDASTGSGPYTGARSYTLNIAGPTLTLWTGTTSTDWFTASNWTAGVPTAGVDATIPTSPSGGRFPAITTATPAANARNLTLNSGATLTQTTGTLALAGNLTNNGTYAASGPAFGNGALLSLGATALSNVFGSSNTRFWNLTVGVSGAQSSTSATTSVQRVLTLNGNLATNGNPFVLESYASGTAMVVNNGGSVVSGNVTVQRYIDPGLNPNRGYRHVSAAVSSATVASLTTSGFTPVVNPAYNTSPTPLLVPTFPTVYGYDQARLASTNNNLNAFDKGWYSPASLSDPLTVGQGYTALIGGGQTWNFTGALNNGNRTVNLARNAGAMAPDAGYALLGNPYPSPLDWSQTSSPSDPAQNGLVNVDPTMYVYRSNDPTNPYTGVYGFYNNGIGTTSPVVAQGQGFFVRVSDGQTAGAVTFKNSHRPTTYQATTYQRTTETRPLVELHLQGAGSLLTDAAFVYFEPGATESFDARYDAEKLPNPSGLNLSTSLSATQRLAIDGRAPLGTTQRVVPLAVGVPAAGPYTLSAAQLLNLGATPVYLRDLQSGAVVDLRQQASYSFTVSNAAALLTGRFELVFAPQAVLATAPAALAAQVGLYPNPATTAAFVELPAALGRTAVAAELVDALGRTMRAQSLPAQGATAHRLDLTNLAAGVYTLHLRTSDGVIVKKLLVE